jgi:predicted transcriptional regulator of viral defense system
MRKEELIQKIEPLGKEFFTLNDLHKLFPDDSYLKIHMSRFLANGVIMSIARGIYTLSAHPPDLEKVATQLYYPSYISFESVLSKYGIMNQGLYKLTLATTRHSKKLTLLGIECDYSKLRLDLFFGFELLDGIYIAEPEKAVLDMLYLISLKKRLIDTSEWYMDELNRGKIAKYAEKYSKTVQIMLSKLL